MRTHGEIVFRDTWMVVEQTLINGHVMPYATKNVHLGEVAYTVVGTRHSQVNLYNLQVMFPEDHPGLQLIHHNVPDNSLRTATSAERKDILDRIKGKELGIL